LNCKKAEKFLVRAMDGLLDEKDKEHLGEHLEKCPLCQQRQNEYSDISSVLRGQDFPEPKPYFWERLQPRLKRQKKLEPWILWKQWSIRAVPLSLLLVVVLMGAMAVFLPRQKQELSRSEDLLLQNRNPFQETRTLFEEEGIEQRNMMLIFATLEDTSDTWRNLP
jgi:predicted anti-sigma-YlaC factor YlaD